MQQERECCILLDTGGVKTMRVVARATMLDWIAERLVRTTSTMARVNGTVDGTCVYYNPSCENDHFIENPAASVMAGQRIYGTAVVTGLASGKIANEVTLVMRGACKYVD